MKVLWTICSVWVCLIILGSFPIFSEIPYTPGLTDEDLQQHIQRQKLNRAFKNMGMSQEKYQLLFMEEKPEGRNKGKLPVIKLNTDEE